MTALWREERADFAYLLLLVPFFGNESKKGGGRIKRFLFCIPTYRHTNKNVHTSAHTYCKSGERMDELFYILGVSWLGAVKGSWQLPSILIEG